MLECEGGENARNNRRQQDNVRQSGKPPDRFVPRMGARADVERMEDERQECNVESRGSRDDYGKRGDSDSLPELHIRAPLEEAQHLVQRVRTKHTVEAQRSIERGDAHGHVRATNDKGAPRTQGGLCRHVVGSAAKEQQLLEYLVHHQLAVSIVQGSIAAAALGQVFRGRTRGVHQKI
eukprot:6741506-Prymnesium_polylepis.2